MCSFAKEMNEIIKLFEGTELCIIGDINEDVSISENRTCCLHYSNQRDCTS